MNVSPHLPTLTRRCTATAATLLAAGALLAGLSPAGANHVQAAIALQAGKTVARGQSDSYTVRDHSGTMPRPVLRVKAGEPVEFRWFLKNASKAKLVNVVVHFFVVKAEQVGQKEPPDPRMVPPVVENASAVDLAPKESIDGVVRTPVMNPGVYLARIETLNSDPKHEHFAAVDLVVE